MANKALGIVQNIARCLPRSHALASLLGPSRLRSVVYHHISSDPSPLTDHLGVATPPEVFDSHLAAFARDYDVIDLDAVLRGKLPKRPLLITFDDAYRSVLDVAAPMLRSRSMPSVFFLNSGVFDSRQLLLDNLLCFLTHKIGIGQVETSITGNPPQCHSLGEIIRRFVSALSYSGRLRLAERLTQEYSVDGAHLLEESHLYLKPEEVGNLIEYGMEVGNHTANHIHCRNLTEAEAVEEIGGAKASLEGLSGRAVCAFSYPYGTWEDVTETTQGVVKTTGHTATFLVQARANQATSDRGIWYRVSVKNCAATDLFLELEILPRIRSFRSRLQRDNRTR